jgi:hypothetical protein
VIARQPAWLQLVVEVKSSRLGSTTSGKHPAETENRRPIGFAMQLSRLIEYDYRCCQRTF